MLFLHDIKNDKLVTYFLKGRTDALKEFKYRFIGDKKTSDLFYWLETNNEQTIKQFIKANEIDVNLVEYENGDVSDYSFSSINYDTLSKAETIISKKCLHEKLLTQYINGEFSYLIPIRTYNLSTPDNGCSYVHNLLRSSSYSSGKSIIGKLFSIENMLDLPTELYILQLLEANQISQLTKSKLEFDQQLQLFEKPIIYSEISLDTLQKLYNSGLITGNINDTINSVEQSQKILQKL